MVQRAKDKVKPYPPNRAQRPKIWEDSMAEVKETFRRVALVKHAGFSVWEDPRRGPTLEKVLRWNRQARILSQVPKSLRDRIPPKLLKEIQNNRSVSGFVSQAHLQNVRGMCQRIHAQKSQSERRKNLNDSNMYPVFIRRPPTVACLIDTTELETSPRNLHSHFRSRRPQSSPVLDYSAPLSYTPQPFKLLYDISNNSSNLLGLSKRPRSGGSGYSSSSASCYGRLFSRPSSAMSRKSALGFENGHHHRQRVSSAPSRQQRLGFPSAPSPASTSSSSPKTRRGHSSGSNHDSESRPPSRCANRPASSGSSWRVSVLQAAPPSVVVEELSNRSTYSDCVSLDSMGMPVLFSSLTSPKDRPRVPRLRLRGGNSGGSSPRKSRLGQAEQPEKRRQQEQQPQEAEFDLMLSDDDDIVRMEQRPSTANVPPVLSGSDSESFTVFNNWRPQSASNAVGRRCSRVTFASPVESNRWEGRARFAVSGGGGGGRGGRGGRGADTSEEEVSEEIDAQEPPQMVEEKEMEDDEVIIKHSSDPYTDFKKSMMNMIESEGLQQESQELEQLFQYYLDLNPKMHHPILARVIQDIKAELKSNPNINSL